MKLGTRPCPETNYERFLKYAVGLKCKRVKKHSDKILKTIQLGLNKKFLIKIPPKHKQIQIRGICALYYAMKRPKCNILISCNQYSTHNMIRFFHRISKEWVGPEWQGSQVDCKIDFEIKTTSKKYSVIKLENGSKIQIAQFGYLKPSNVYKKYSIAFLDKEWQHDRKLLKIINSNKTLFFHEGCKEFIVENI